MKMDFDEEQWQRLQEDLEVGRLCAENAGKVYAYAKGSLQRATAAIIGNSEVTADEARHSLQLLKKLWNNSHDAAQAFTAAAAAVRCVIRQLEAARREPAKKS